jgi:hypothetical protein
MTVLLIGDSFSDPSWAKNNYKAWPELLAQDFEITNLSAQGTSTWWSFLKYQQHKSDFEKIIFTVTVPNRLYIESLDKHLTAVSSNWFNGINLEQTYYKYFYSEAQSNFMQHHIVKELLTDTKVLIIPAFKESIPDHDGISLCHIADLESDYYNIPRPILRDNKRKCHLGRENNLMIYKKILQALQNSDKILRLTAEDFVIPTDPKSVYF